MTPAKFVLDRLIEATEKMVNASPFEYPHGTTFKNARAVVRELLSEYRQIENAQDQTVIFLRAAFTDPEFLRNELMPALQKEINRADVSIFNKPEPE